MTWVLFSAWSLLSAPMLAWSAAIAIPIAIHFWSRRRYREHTFAAMQFLLAAMKKHARRLQVEQWLLLAVRIATLLLFAFALANPIWSWSRTERPSSSPRHLFFVVDTSFSMAWRLRDQTLLQTAQEEIRQLVDEAGDGASFTLLRMEEAPQLTGSEVMFSKSEFLEHLGRIEPAHAAARLAPALRAADELCERIQDRYPQLATSQIHWFTDLGNNTWSEASTAECRASLESLAERSALLLHDLAPPDRPNLAVTALKVSPTQLVPGQKLTVTAEVRAFGSPLPPAPKLEVLVDDRVIHVANLQLVPGGRASVDATYSAVRPGEHVVLARLSVDPLLLDNERRAVVTVRNATRVLICEGKPDAGKFVAIALQPDATSSGPIEVTVASPSALLEEDLSQFAALFLCNIERLSPAEINALRPFVESGGGLIWSLGDEVQIDEYNRTLLSGAAGLLPARLGSLMHGEWTLDPLEYEHPLVRPFRGRERAGLLTAPVWCYCRIEPNASATVALAASSGDPLVVEQPIGRGRIFLIATALSTSSMDTSRDPPLPWNALPAWPSFPPLMHGLLQASTVGRGSQRTVEVGTSLQLETDVAAREIMVTLPDGSQRRMPGDGSDRGPRTFADTRLSGVYRVEVSGESASTSLFAVNLDPVESHLVSVPVASLPDELSQSAKTWVATGNLAGTPTVELFRPLLVAVGLLLLLEHALATAFARRGM